MELEDQAILDYFSDLGFEQIPIEEGLTALSFEDGPDGDYMLVTDEDGNLPASLDVPLMLACYTAEGAFLWSTGFKNANHLKELWSKGESYAEKLSAAQRHRAALMDPRLLEQI